MNKSISSQSPDLKYSIDIDGTKITSLPFFVLDHLKNKQLDRLHIRSSDTDLALQWEDSESLREAAVMYAMIAGFEVLKGSACLWCIEQKIHE